MHDGSGEPPPADAGAAPFVWSAEVAAAFPPAFVAFLQQNDIHPDNYNVPSPPRYFRIVRRAGVEAVAARELEVSADFEPAGDAERLKPSALALKACGESRLHLVSVLCSACSFRCSRLRGRGVALFATGSARLYSHMCVEW